MDTSETYIKMRVKAIPELGMGTPPTKSTPCFITNNVWVDAVGNWYLIYNLGKEDVIIGCQLERQDQLQKMMNRKIEDLVEGLYRFISDTGRDDWESWFRYIRQFTSMEQLWFAFVMKEEYGKYWDGENWVKGK